jgi:anti-anti-sigma factor
MPLLQRLEQQPGMSLGLLTGNLKRGAQLKLEHYQLWHFFAFGAFADDHHDRNQLGAFAMTRAHEKTGAKFLPAEVDVIGDTGHDIACGKAFGARTIAIATGSWPREQLAEYAPDFLFDDLSQQDEVIAKLGWGTIDASPESDILPPTLTTMSLPDEPNVLALEGEIDLHVSPRVAESLRALAEKKPERLVVDLSRVTYIDSSGLAALIEGMQNVEAYGGKFVLAGVQENVRPIFEIARLDQVFIIFPHVDAALAAP